MTQNKTMLSVPLFAFCFVYAMMLITKRFMLAIIMNKLMLKGWFSEGCTYSNSVVHYKIGLGCLQ